MSSFKEKLEQRANTRETMAKRRQQKEVLPEDEYIEQMVVAAKAHDYYATKTKMKVDPAYVDSPEFTNTLESVARDMLQARLQYNALNSSDSAKWDDKKHNKLVKIKIDATNNASHKIKEAIATHVIEKDQDAPIADSTIKNGSAKIADTLSHDMWLAAPDNITELPNRKKIEDKKTDSTPIVVSSAKEAAKWEKLQTMKQRARRSVPASENEDRGR